MVSTAYLRSDNGHGYMLPSERTCVLASGRYGSSGIVEEDNQKR